MQREKITKILSFGIILMGIIHIIATFTPMIADKIALLPVGAQKAFTYFSLMCGTLLVLGGSMTLTLSCKVSEYPFIRKPYITTIVILIIAGLFAIGYMPYNPFAWIIFVLVIGLKFATRYTK